MIGRTACALAVSTWIACAASSCTTADVTLATLPTGGDGGGFNAQCSSKEDCGSGFYCEMAACDATAGTCVPFPATCDGEEHEVCGCDGVTYFNDCLRKQALVTATYAAGSCGLGLAAACTSDANCPQTAVCFQVAPAGPGPCPTDVQGSCWVIPLGCPPPPPPPSGRWDACSGDRHCVDTCNAIKSQEPFRPAAVCH